MMKDSKTFYVLKDGFTGKLVKSECGAEVGELFAGTEYECDKWIAEQETPKELPETDNSQRDFGNSLKGLTAEQSLKVAQLISSFEKENKQIWLEKETDYVRRFWERYCKNLKSNKDEITSEILIKVAVEMYREGAKNACNQLAKKCQDYVVGSISANNVSHFIEEMGIECKDIH